MVRAMKSIAGPSLPLSVYEPAKLLHNASHGVHLTILDCKSLYLYVCLLFTWQVLHHFVIDQIVFLIPFWYIAAFIASLRWVCQGC